MKYSTFFALITSLFILSSCSKDEDPLPLPDPPSDLVGTTISSSEIRLDWTDNSDNEDGFVLKQRGDYPVVGKDIVLGPDVTSYLDTGLLEITIYNYELYAFNKDNPIGRPNPESTRSGNVWTFGKPVTLPSWPTYITSVSIGSVLYMQDDGGQPILEHGVIWDINDDPDTTVITKSKQGLIDKGEFSLYDITGLLPNTKYYIRGYAINSVGLSYSSTYSVITYE